MPIPSRDAREEESDMKWFMAIAAVLALPAMAFGAASFSLTSGGASAITIAPNDSFDVNVTINYSSPVTGITGFDAGLSASTDNIFQCTARSWVLTKASSTRSDSWFTSAAYYNDVYVNPVANQNIGGIRSIGAWTDPSPLDCENLSLYNAIGTPGVYTLTLVSPGAAGLNILDGQSPAQKIDGVTSSTLQVTITPEPASMLLLVGALPFLRRRRSA